MKTVVRSAKIKMNLEDAYQRVQYDRESVKPFFDAINDVGMRNLNFYVGNQWSDEEIAAHHEQNREPIVFNEILHKVDHLVGSQMQTRMDSKAVAREPSDEATAQLLTYLLKWVEQVNSLQDLETQIFRNGIITGCAAAAIYWETGDIPYGYPKIDYIPFGELSWDLRAIKPDLSDARWMCRSALLSRIELAEMFPQHQTHIFAQNNTPDTYKMSYQDMFDRRTNISGYSTSNYDRDLIEYHEHYEKIKINQWLVVDDIRNEVTRFDSKQDAEEFYNGLMQGYIDGNISTTLEDELGTERVLLMTTSTTKVIQTIVIGDKAVSRELLNIPDFPYIIYFAYWLEGTFFGFVDNLIDPQIEVNRSWSQWDFALGTQNKGVKTVVESMLKRGWDIEKVRQEASKTNVWIPVLAHGAIVNQPEGAVNPQIFSTMQFAISRMTDYAGGRNALGFSENAAESGRAVMARAEAGGVARLSLFENLRLWRMKVAERIVWYLKNYTSPQQIVRLIGNQQDVFYVSLNKDILDSLREIKTDIVVSEAVNADNISERYFNQLVNFFQVTKVPAEISMPMLLEYTSLPETKKEELRQYFELYKAYMQEQAKLSEQQKIEKQVMGQIQRADLRAQVEASKAQEEALAVEQAGLNGVDQQAQTEQLINQQLQG